MGISRRAIRSIAIAVIAVLLAIGLTVVVHDGQPVAEPRTAQQADDETTPILVRTRYDEMIRVYAGRYGVDAALVKAVVHAESGFRVRVRSRCGARGLMQVMPRTARAYGVRNLYDPKQNLRAGIRYLRHLLDRHDNDPKLALAAYNAGSGAVRAYGGVPPYAETRGYVARVLKFQRAYQTAAAPAESPRS